MRLERIEKSDGEWLKKHEVYCETSKENRDKVDKNNYVINDIQRIWKEDRKKREERELFSKNNKNSKEGEIYFIESDQSDILRPVIEQNTPILVQYLKWNLYKELISGIIMEYNGIVNNVSDELKIEYYQKILSNEEMKNKINNTMSLCQNKKLAKMWELFEKLEIIHNFDHNQINGKLR